MSNPFVIPGYLIETLYLMEGKEPANDFILHRKKKYLTSRKCYALQRIICRRPTIIICICFCFVYIISIYMRDVYWNIYDWLCSEDEMFFQQEPNDFDFSLANNITGFPSFIVPNIVHFVRFEQPILSFIEMLSIRSVLINHNPDKIMLHCDMPPTGHYWDMIKNTSIIEVVYCRKPRRIFNQKIDIVQHASDVARLKILRKFGGIYLDNDVLVIHSLLPYLSFEFTIGWDDFSYMGNQVLICHRDARFLKLYYNSYREFNDDNWYWNAGEGPTKNILWKNPELVHRVKERFGIRNLIKELYVDNNMPWLTYDTIHLLMTHRFHFVPDVTVAVFNENNIKNYLPSFGKIARYIFYGDQNVIPVS